jgi:hypothetical protein
MTNVPKTIADGSLNMAPLKMKKKVVRAPMI